VNHLNYQIQGVEVAGGTDTAAAAVLGIYTYSCACYSQTGAPSFWGDNLTRDRVCNYLQNLHSLRREEYDTS
jgi:hypothetical protein